MIKTPERRQWLLSGVFIFNFEQKLNIGLSIAYLEKSKLRAE